jgi:predicted DNA-binding ribbon-helix-helix protein
VVDDRKQDDETLTRTGKSLTSRVLIVRGRRTSARLEEEIWTSFKDIAKDEGCSVHELASHIDSRKKGGQSFTSAIRVFVMLYYRDAATVAGHAKAGHGRSDRSTGKS